MKNKLKKFAYTVGLLTTLGLGYFMYDNQNVDMNEFKALNEKFYQNIDGFDCPHITQEISGWLQDTYDEMKKKSEQIHSYSKQAYLEDKLLYYDETAFLYKDQVGYFQTFVEEELEKLNEDVTVPKSEWFKIKEELYLKTVANALPWYKELAFFVDNNLQKDPTDITKQYLKELKKALQTCEQISQQDKTLPSLYFKLDNVNGRVVTIDNFEYLILEKYINESIQKKDLQKANAWYVMLIQFQVIQCDSYLDDITATIDEYRDFLEVFNLPVDNSLEALQQALYKIDNSIAYERDIYFQRRYIHYVETLQRDLKNKSSFEKNSLRKKCFDDESTCTESKLF
jgi:hypothetical protein